MRHRPAPLTRAQAIGLLLVFAGAAALQLWRIHDPFMLRYETGFQEQIARRHLDPGLAVTKGISTLNNLDPEPTPHATHPPLLQLTLAALFAVFGDSEAAARLVPMASYLACMAGLWRLTAGYLSNPARLGTLAVFAFMPLSAHMGRVVNFEAPALAMAVWTAAAIGGTAGPPSRRRWYYLSALAAAGTLIDWTYLLFLTCAAVLARFSPAAGKARARALGVLWGVSLLTASVYFSAVLAMGALGDVMHHVRVQSGAHQPDGGWTLPLFLTWDWHRSLFERLWRYGPWLAFAALPYVWLRRAFAGNRFHGPFYWLGVWTVFPLAYAVLFSRASHQHFWCLFYFAPAMALAYGILLDRFRWFFQIALVAAAVAFSVPALMELRLRTPHLAQAQFGRSIAGATERLHPEKRSRMKGPLLYTNRADPLAYYSRFETAYFYMSIGATLPHRFLVRFRPEFVALTGLDSRTAFTLREGDGEDLFGRLNQSYVLTHKEHGTELWESLWSPYLSMMGMIASESGHPVRKQLLDDGDTVRVAAFAFPGEPAIRFDTGRAWRAGRRAIEGWAIAHQTHSSDSIRVSVASNKNPNLGAFDIPVQSAPPKWQPFRIDIGYPPDSIAFSWSGQKIIWGDVRLVSEIAWCDDLTRVLAGEIRRRMGPEPYGEILRLEGPEGVTFPVSQRLGRGADRVQLPPVRLGLYPSLDVAYRIHPGAGQAGPVLFRLRMRDYPMGKPLVLFEDTMNRPGAGRTRMIDLSQHARHLVSFTFEVEGSPGAAFAGDAALWTRAVLLDE